MSQIDTLIKDLLPLSVPYRRIGDVAQVGTGSSDRKDSTEDGQFPFYVRSNRVMRIDKFEFDEEAIVIPGEGGVGEIYHFVSGKYALHQRAYRISFKAPDIDTKFAFYYFVAHFKKFILQKAVSATVTSIRKPMITDFPIPVPPIEVQREIVAILDTFTGLEAELEAELQAELKSRRSQYSYHQNALLDFGETGQTKYAALGELGVLFGGLTGKSKSDFQDGNARFVSYMNVFKNSEVDLSALELVSVGDDERQRALHRGDILFTGSSESRAECGMSSVLTAEPEGAVFLNSFCIGFRLHDTELFDPGFAKHLFRSDFMRRQIVLTASGVTRFNVSKARLAKVLVPLPSSDEQRRIAKSLDSLKDVTLRLSERLSGELFDRRRQYKFYRDRLLEFEETTA